MGLSQDQIEALLKKEIERASSKTPTGRHERCMQIGPLKYADESAPCTSRGCTSPTLIRVNGAAKCSTHALYELNFFIIERQYGPEELSICDCNSGKYSRSNVHNPECALFKYLKTQDRELPVLAEEMELL